MMKAFQRNKQPAKTLDDIVFENRNKEYGCYDLRTNYHRRFGYSFVIVLFIILIANLILYFWQINPLFESSSKIDNTYFETVKYNPDMLPLLIRLPEVPKEKPATLIAATEPKITKELVEMPKNKHEKPFEKFNPMPVVDCSFKKLTEDRLKRQKDLLKERTFPTDSIKMILEKAPQFPGGNSAIQSFIYQNQKYPAGALLTGTQGSTIVSFVVNEKGMVEDVKVVSAIDFELDMEAVRLVKSMPQWQPAYYKGKPIACMLIIPVDFAIR